MSYKQEKLIKDILRDFSRTLVGRTCKQNEIIQQRNDLSADQKLSLLKALNKELIYEECRGLENLLKAHSKGIQLEKFKVYDPTTK